MTPKDMQGGAGKGFRMTKPYRLIVNDDGGRGYWNWVAPLSAEQYLEAVCGTQVAGKPVDALFWTGLQNPTGIARYNTKVGEVQGSRPPAVMTAGEWTFRTTLLGMIAQGHDPLALICDRCHDLGTDAWLSFRFNDAHHCYTANHEKGSKASRIYLERPDLRIGPDHGWKMEVAERLWDYVKAGVRDHVFALLQEAYLDYDVDGVELDFMRHPAFFPKARVDEGREIMNAFIARLRALADEAAERKGRPQGLAVRVPSYEPACAEIGLDWRTWVREGWVDVLTASAFHSAEHEVDLAPFVEGCRDSRTLVYWCIESTAGFPNVEYNTTIYYGGVPNGPSTEHYRGMALGAYEQGVDGLYFFNFHFAFERYATHPDVAFLHELHDPDLLRGRDHIYLVSRQTADSHDRFFQCAPPRPLPRSLTAEERECSLALTVGADLKGAAAAKTLRSARLRLLLTGLTAVDKIAVLWDGAELAGAFEPPLAPGTWQQWSGRHFWVADLTRLGLAPARGKHECTVRLEHRNPEVDEPIVVDFCELDVRFWVRPGMPR